VRQRSRDGAENRHDSAFESFARRSENEIKERITFQISRGAGARTTMPTANR